MKSLNKILGLSIIFIIFLFFSYEVYNHTKISSSKDLPNIVINNSIIRVEEAGTLEEQIKGLSNRKYLSPNSGMLFIFKNKQIQKFWMKNMNFPLDIIWINDNKIINISKNLPPENDLPKKIYNSDDLCNYVLEVNAGFADKNNIKIGDYVKYNLQAL
jgi:uncharacterized membrane protein (UPF0127 family)